MSDAHRSKRRRISQNAEQFLDLEAGVDYDDPSEGEQDSEDEAFIDVENLEDEDGDHQDHARLLLTLSHADDAAQAAPPPPAPQEHDQVTITHATERVVDLIGGTNLSAGIWELRCRYGQEAAMVDRVNSILPGQPPDLRPHTCVLAVNWMPHLRGRIFIEVSDEADPRQQQNYLMACLDALVRPPFYQKRFHPFQGITDWVKNWPKARTAHTFARVRRFGCYKGDLAYIFPRNDVLWLALVPRIALNPNFKGKRPARATVTTRIIQLSRLSNKTVDIHEVDGYFMFQGKRLTLEGYLLVALDDVQLFPEINPVPTMDELGRFKDLAQMPSHIRNDYFLGSVQRRMSVHDRVWIKHGEFQGQAGFIQESREAEADIYFPHEDSVGTVLFENLRGHFEIGDQVAIHYGSHKGNIGFVVRSENGMVAVANPLTLTEVEIPLEHVFFWEMPRRVATPQFEIGDEVIIRNGPDRGLQGVVDSVRNSDIVIREGDFFPLEFEVPVASLRRLDIADSSAIGPQIGDEVQVTAPGEHHDRAGSIIAISASQIALIREGPSHLNIHTIPSCYIEHTSIPKRNDLVLQIRQGNFDPHCVLMGKHCTIVAGPLKGYRGRVIGTHPSGLITIEHEARLQAPAQYPRESLAMHDEHPHLQVPRVASPVPVRSSTPPNDNIPDRPLSPAWNPAAPTPELPVILTPPEPDDALPPTWILEPEFASLKVKIFLRGSFGAGPIGMFKGMQGGLVRFNHTGNNIELLSMSYMRHVTPKEVNDLVVAIEGDYKGRILRVREFGPIECTLSEYKVRRQSKKYVPPVVKTLHLARVTPL